MSDPTVKELLDKAEALKKSEGPILDELNALILIFEDAINDRNLGRSNVKVDLFQGAISLGRKKDGWRLFWEFDGERILARECDVATRIKVINNLSTLALRILDRQQQRVSGAEKAITGAKEALKDLETPTRTSG